jgi:hypothetical protein
MWQCRLDLYLIYANIHQTDNLISAHRHGQTKKCDISDSELYPELLEFVFIPTGMASKSSASPQATYDDADLVMQLFTRSSMPEESASTPPATRKRKTRPQPQSKTNVVDIPSARRRKSARLYRNHSTYWEEGDVYVRAGHIRFKLHKTRLARLSSWFRDVLEQNTAEDTHGVVEVVLDKMDVCAEDFAALLDALDNSMCVTPCHRRTFGDSDRFAVLIENTRTPNLHSMRLRLSYVHPPRCHLRASRPGHINTSKPCGLPLLPLCLLSAPRSRWKPSFLPVGVPCRPYSSVLYTNLFAWRDSGRSTKSRTTAKM